MLAQKLGYNIYELIDYWGANNFEGHLRWCKFTLLKLNTFIAK